MLKQIEIERDLEWNSIMETLKNEDEIERMWHEDNVGAKGEKTLTVSQKEWWFFGSRDPQPFIHDNRYQRFIRERERRERMRVKG